MPSGATATPLPLCRGLPLVELAIPMPRRATEPLDDVTRDREELMPAVMVERLCARRGCRGGKRCPPAPP